MTSFRLTYVTLYGAKSGPKGKTFEIETLGFDIAIWGLQIFDCQIQK